MTNNKNNNQTFELSHTPISDSTKIRIIKRNLNKSGFEEGKEFILEEGKDFTVEGAMLHIKGKKRPKNMLKTKDKYRLTVQYNY